MGFAAFELNVFYKEKEGVGIGGSGGLSQICTCRSVNKKSSEKHDRSRSPLI